ncbi:MAG: OmpA family protein [Lachnospiraceae bacterium]|nr:OmpA family protein [Lachnospiraceae bacterium]
MAYRRNKVEDEEVSYWLSYSDMMAALLLTFVLIISFTMLQARSQYEQKEQELAGQQQIVAEQQALVARQQEVMEAQQEQLDQIIGIRGEVVESLKEEFENTNLKITVDSQTGSITFDSGVLFDYNQYMLKASGEAFLKEFLPRYFHVLLSQEYKDYIGEVIIEGHTDTQGSYITNLELSQKRALAVAAFCLADESNVLPTMDIHELRDIVTANGRSYSNPIYNEDGTVNMEASRRVEVKFRLKDEDMIDEMLSILNENS